MITARADMQSVRAVCFIIKNIAAERQQFEQIKGVRNNEQLFAPTAISVHRRLMHPHTYGKAGLPQTCKTNDRICRGLRCVGVKFTLYQIPKKKVLSFKYNYAIVKVGLQSSIE